MLPIDGPRPLPVRPNSSHPFTWTPDSDSAKRLSRSAGPLNRCSGRLARHRKDCNARLQMIAPQRQVELRGMQLDEYENRLRHSLQLQLRAHQEKAAHLDRAVANTSSELADRAASAIDPPRGCIPTTCLRKTRNRPRTNGSDSPNSDSKTAASSQLCSGATPFSKMNEGGFSTKPPKHAPLKASGRA